MNQNDLPGPLKSFLSIPIEVQDAEDKLNDATNQLAHKLDIRQKVTTRRRETLKDFSDALRAWQSQRPVTAPAQQEEIEQLKAQIQELEPTRQDKEKLEQSLKSEIKQLEQQLEKERSQAVKQLEDKEQSLQSLQSQIRQLEQQLSITTITSTKIIKIFLASSSELKEDREQFEGFINRKNKEYIRKGIFLELVMWEDFLDAMSPTRLQDEYNKAITDCDVFVSLFHTKVGQYTEEEFEKAFATFKANEKPLIYTFFKESPILPSQAKQMQSVFNFQGKLSELGHFYTKYQDINHLKYLFDQQLDKFIPELTNIQQENPSPSGVFQEKQTSVIKSVITTSGVVLKEFNFEVLTVNGKGEEVKRDQSQAQYFTENLGNGIKLEMIAIPGGTFMMGSPEGEGYDREKPQHEVTVQPFFMGKYPITQAQYQQVMGKNPSRFKGDDRPVEQVSWEDAVEFCQRLSKQTGTEYRLPSEVAPGAT